MNIDIKAEPETFDNRLLYTLRSDTSDPNNVVLEERTDYEYSLFTGNPKRIVKRPPVGTSGSAYGTWFIYDEAERLRGIIAQNWAVDPNTGEPVDPGACVRTLHKEFRYDGNRQRYLERERQPQPIPLKLYYNAWGGQEAAIGSGETRYGFVGAQGYQTEANTGYQHLGARYYDPAIGRFLMRDPIGINGGLNVYEYAYNSPIIMTDPTGLLVYVGPLFPVGPMTLAPPSQPLTKTDDKYAAVDKEVRRAEFYEGVDKGLAGTITVLKIVRAEVIGIGVLAALPVSAPVAGGIDIAANVLTYPSTAY